MRAPRPPPGPCGRPASDHETFGAARKATPIVVVAEAGTTHRRCLTRRTTLRFPSTVPKIGRETAPQSFPLNEAGITPLARLWVHRGPMRLGM